MAMENNKERCSNFEVLRIVAMLMIIAHHLCVHGVFNYWHTNTNCIEHVNNILITVVALGGKIGVDIFVLITGYFLILSDYKIKKFLKIYLKTLLYSVLLLAVSAIYGEHHVPSTLLNVSIFPFGGNAYWFVSTYLMLYLLVPCINHFIKTSSQNMLNSLMLILTFLWVLVPTFTPADYCFSNLAFFIYLYFIGASYRLKTFFNFIQNDLLLSKLSILSFIVLLIYIIIRSFDTNINFWAMYKLGKMNTVFILLISLNIFVLFKNWKFKYNSFVNLIASSVFGVYLFHDNKFVKPFLWHHIVRPVEHMNSPYLLVHILFSVILIFIAGIIIDKCINYILMRPMNTIFNKLQQSKIMKNLYNYILNRCYAFQKISQANRNNQNK